MSIKEWGEMPISGIGPKETLRSRRTRSWHPQIDILETVY